MFVQYAIGKKKEYQENLLYKTYVTDSLRLMGENKYLDTRWIDLITDNRIEDIDAESVVDDIVNRAGLVVI